MVFRTFNLKQNPATEKEKQKNVLTVVDSIFIRRGGGNLVTNKGGVSQTK